MLGCSIVCDRNFCIKVKSIDYPAVEPPFVRHKRLTLLFFFLFSETVFKIDLFSVFAFQQFSYEKISAQPLKLITELTPYYTLLLFIECI